MKLHFKNSKWAKTEATYPKPFEDAVSVEAFVYPLTPSPGIVYSTGNNTLAGCTVKAESSIVLDTFVEIGVDVRVEMNDGSFVYQKFQ